jgi:hypothetical protein
MYSILVVILALMGGTLTASTQDTKLDTQELPVTLCDLVARPNEYAGRVVRLKATLASDMEELEIFRDDSCRPAPAEMEGTHPIVQATFNESQYQFKSSIDKKLTKLLKKKKQARVIVVGVFTDPGHYFGHQLCCRYRLDVLELLSVEEMTKADARPTSYRACNRQ